MIRWTEIKSPRILNVGIVLYAYYIRSPMDRNSILPSTVCYCSWLGSYPLHFFITGITIQLNIICDVKLKPRTKSWTLLYLNPGFQGNLSVTAESSSRVPQLTCPSFLVTRFSSIQLHHLYTCPLGREAWQHLPVPWNQCRPKIIFGTGTVSWNISLPL
jgi:hypothetical protein